MAAKILFVQPRAVLFGDLNLLRCLGPFGVRVSVLGADPDDLSFHSRYCLDHHLIACPLRRPHDAIDDLLAIGRDAHPERPVLFYDNDPMLLLISRHRAELQNHFRFLMPAADLIEDLVSKVRFADLARRLNLPTPKTIASADARSASHALASLSLPCIFKPVCHVGWSAADVLAEARGKPFKALVASSLEEFTTLWEKMSLATDHFVVQEYVPGADDLIYSFHAYFDKDSRPLAHFVGRKIRTFPKSAGISTCLHLVEEPRVVQLGMEILSRLNFVGPVKLDFKLDQSRGRFHLLEINPRFNLWHHLGAACGINLPLIAYRDLLGFPPAIVSSYRTDIRWLSFENDLRAFLSDYHPDGELSWPRYLWSLAAPTVHDVFSWRDPYPFAVAAARRAARLRHRFARKRKPTARPATQSQ